MSQQQHFQGGERMKQTPNKLQKKMSNRITFLSIYSDLTSHKYSYLNIKPGLCTYFNN